MNMFLFAVNPVLQRFPCPPVFVWCGHSAGVCRARDRWDRCSNSPQVLDDRGEELLTGTLVQVKADLIGHQQVVLLHKLLQDVTHGLWVVEEDQALQRWGEKEKWRRVLGCNAVLRTSA